MSSLKDLFQAEQHTMQRGFVRRMATLSDESPPVIEIRTILMMWVIVGCAAGLVLQLLGLGFMQGPEAAIGVVGFVGAMPLFNWLGILVWRGYGSHWLKDCSLHLKMFYGMAIGTVIGKIIVPLVSNNNQGLLLGAAAIGFGVFFPAIADRLAGRQVWSGIAARKAAPAQQPAPQPIEAARSAPGERPFALRLGYSTGQLAELGHGAGMAPNQPVVLDMKDACQNTIAFGGIGQGKTTRLINPLLLQLLSQDAGALVFDIKTSFIRELDYLAHQAGRSYQVIGEGGMPFNLLEGLTPEMGADFLKSAFLVSEGGKPGGSSAFWVDSAVELCRNCLGLLQFFPEKYTLPGLYRFVFDAEEQTNVFEAIEDLQAAGAMTDYQTRLVQTNRFYFDKVWADASDNVAQGVRSTVAQVLAPFQHPALVDAFCTAGQGLPRLEDMVNNGTVFLVEIPMTKYGKEGSKIAYLFIKRRFMQVMKERENHKGEWNQTRPVVFLCDEYQSIIDPVSDLDFWDKSRSAKTVGIVSMQGMSSLYAAIGDEKIADAIAQNFRNVLAFRTEDGNTLKRLEGVLGQVDVTKVSESQSNSTNESNHGGSTGKSYSRSVSTERRNVINAQQLRTLDENQAVAVLSIGGKSFDDVISCSTIFIPDDYALQQPVTQ